MGAGAHGSIASSSTTLESETQDTFTHAPRVVGGEAALIREAMRGNLNKVPQCLMYQHLHASKCQWGHLN